LCWQGRDIKMQFCNRKPKWYLRLLRKNPFLKIPCADHTKFTKDGCVVLEPYNRGKGEFRDLISFCDKNGLNFLVSGESIHYPGHTFRIKIFEKDYISHG